ncbi:hypothetical protein HK097_006494 [Rhizophlyctis rosea]|uniref:Uncharacterized protein n=1 Tax=Rhizophlyctis rosea TaxID=64517 RepID=A0AAD5SFX8_9FUNG|nr:hypothetical protein HK097_006494 [Rhizophlyctis rosea]
MPGWDFAAYLSNLSQPAINTFPKPLIMLAATPSTITRPSSPLSQQQPAKFGLHSENSHPKPPFASPYSYTSTLTSVLDLGRGLGLENARAEPVAAAEPGTEGEENFLMLLEKLVEVQRELHKVQHENLIAREYTYTSDVTHHSAIGTVKMTHRSKTLTEVSDHLTNITTHFPDLINKLKDRPMGKDHVTLDMAYQNDFSNLFQSILHSISSWAEDANHAKWGGAIDGRVEELEGQVREVMKLAEAQVRYADSVDELRRGSKGMVE